MNKSVRPIFFIIVGVLGALINLFGLTQLAPQSYFIVGASFLLLTAIYYKLTYFIALEMILLSGHAGILFGLGPILQVALPTLLCLQLLTYYLLSHQLDNLYLLLGIIGIALLSIGLSYQHQWVFFCGSLGVAIYAFYRALEKKANIVLLWAIPNSIFAMIAAFKIVGESYG